MKALRDRLTFSNTISVIALFVALGGSAYAVGKNTIGSGQLKTGAVQRSDIAANSINSKKVARGSLLRSDFRRGQLPRGAKGETGAPGAAGATGAAGSAVAFAEVGPDGTVVANSGARNITNANIDHTAATGIYCFKNLPAGTSQVMVVADNNGGTGGFRDTLVSANYDSRTAPGTPNLLGCTAGVHSARVSTMDINNAAGANTAGTFNPQPGDRPFIVWFED